MVTTEPVKTALGTAMVAWVETATVLFKPVQLAEMALCNSRAIGKR
jgi:hypothetical protein